jgi:hypothetical protein
MKNRTAEGEAGKVFLQAANNAMKSILSQHTSMKSGRGMAFPAGSSFHYAVDCTEGHLTSSAKNLSMPRNVGWSRITHL